MKFHEEVPLEKIDERLGGALSAGECVYCHVCDGLRPKEHTCICWVTGKPVSECPCSACVEERGS